MVKSDEKGTTVEGIPVDTHRKENLVEAKTKEECCPLCALDLNVTYSVRLIDLNFYIFTL